MIPLGGNVKGKTGGETRIAKCETGSKHQMSSDKNAWRQNVTRAFSGQKH